MRLTDRLSHRRYRRSPVRRLRESLLGRDETACGWASRRLFLCAVLGMFSAQAAGRQLEACLGEAQVFQPVLVGPLQLFGVVPILVDRRNRFRSDVPVGLGVHAARDGQAYQPWLRIAVIAGLGIAAGADDPALYRAHTGVRVEPGRR